MVRDPVLAQGMNLVPCAVEPGLTGGLLLSFLLLRKRFGNFPDCFFAQLFTRFAGIGLRLRNDLGPRRFYCRGSAFCIFLSPEPEHDASCHKLRLDRIMSAL